MKRFAISAALIATLAMSGPLSAQQAPAPSTPGPATAAPSAPAQEMNRMPAGGKATSERGQTGSVTRAHHRRHYAKKSSTSSAPQTTSPGTTK